MNKEYNIRNSISDSLKKYDYLSKESDFIEITEWVNGEGWDITINDRHFSLSYGELEAITCLTKDMEYNKDAYKNV